MEEIFISYLVTKGLDYLLRDKKDELCSSMNRVYGIISRKYAKTDGDKSHFCGAKVVQEGLVEYYYDKNYDIKQVIAELRKLDWVIPFDDKEVIEVFNDFISECRHENSLVNLLLLRKNESLSEQIKELSTKIDKLQSIDSEQASLIKKLMDALSEQIQKLKLKSAADILEKIENHFARSTSKFDAEIVVEIKYYKALCYKYTYPNLYSDLIKESYELLCFAKIFRYDIMLAYIKHKALNGEPDEARTLMIEHSMEHRRMNDPIVAFLQCVLSGDFVEEVRKQSSQILSNRLFIRCCYEHVIRHKITSIENLNFLDLEFLDLPTSICYDNLYEFIHVAEYATHNYQVEEGVIPYVMNHELVVKTHQILSQIWEEIKSYDEIRSDLSMIGLFSSYLGFLLYQNQDDYKEFVKLEKQIPAFFRNQNTSLLTANINFRCGNFNDAYNALSLMPVGEESLYLKMLYSLEQGNNPVFIDAFKQYITLRDKNDYRTIALIIQFISSIDLMREMSDNLKSITFAEKSDRLFLDQYIKYSVEEDVDVTVLLEIKESIHDSLRMKWALMLASTDHLSVAADYAMSLIDWKSPNEHYVLDFLLIGCRYHVNRQECYKLINIFIQDVHLFSNEIINWILQMANEIEDDETVWDILEDLVKYNPEDENLLCRYLLTAYRKKDYDIVVQNINRVFSFDFKHEKSIVKLSNLFLMIDRPKEALTLCYKYASVSTMFEVRMFYFNLALIPKVGELIFDSNSVVEEFNNIKCTKLDDSEKQFSVCVSRSRWTKAFVGKKRGDNVTCNDNINDEITVRIDQVINKYEALYQEIFSDFDNNNKSMNYPVKPLKVDTDNPSELFDILDDLSDKKEFEESQRVRDENKEKYKKRSSSLYLSFEDSWIEGSYDIVFNSSVKLRQQPMCIDELKISHQIKSPKVFVPDLTALWLLSSLDKIVYTKNCHLVVSKKLVNAIRNEKLRIEHLSYQNEQSELYIQRITNLLNWINTNCEEVLVHERLGITDVSKAICDGDMGHLADWFFLCSRDNHVIISDDWAFGYPSFMGDKLPVISSETFINFFTTQLNDFNISRYLFDSGRVGCSVSSNDIVEIISRFGEESVEFKRLCNTVKMNPFLSKVVVEASIELMSMIMVRQVYKPYISVLFKILIINELVEHIIVELIDNSDASSYIKLQVAECL